MKAELAKHLFQDMPSDYVYVPPTRWQRVKRFFSNIKNWIKWRFIGTWNVWTKGECGSCESDW